MHPADTPRKLGAVEALRERRVLVYQRRHGRYHVWPDARICRCLYVGDEARYQACVRLDLEQKLERERETAAEEREPAALFTSARDWDPAGRPRPKRRSDDGRTRERASPVD